MIADWFHAIQAALFPHIGAVVGRVLGSIGLAEVVSSESDTVFGCERGVELQVLRARFGDRGWFRCGCWSRFGCGCISQHLSADESYIGITSIRSPPCVRVPRDVTQYV